METRNVTLTLQKAKEFYNSGNTALKEVALQAFTEKELTVPDYTDIKTFEDACIALGIHPYDAEYDILNIEKAEGGFGKHLTAIYKLDIIRKALNGADWNPANQERVWSTWLSIRADPSFKEKVIGNILIDGRKYSVISNPSDYIYTFGLFNMVLGKSGTQYSEIGLFACKSKEIAHYMAEQFGQIMFDAAYAQYAEVYKWV